MADITLSSAVRNNLLSLQNTADLLGRTQERLATGLKVNSALDDPTAFFTAASLNSRASDLNRLLDSVGNSLQTIKAADQGISAITKLVENAQANARQALQKPGIANATITGTGAAVAADTAATVANTAAALTAESVGTVTGTGNINGETDFVTNTTISEDDVFQIDINGVTQTITFGTDGGEVNTTAALVAAVDGLAGVSAALNGNFLEITGDTFDTTITINAGSTAAVLTELGFTGGQAETGRVNLLTGQGGAITAGETLTFTVGSGSTQTVTFGTNDGGGEVSTIAELNTALGNLTGFASISAAADGDISFTATDPAVDVVVDGTVDNTVFGFANAASNTIEPANATIGALTASSTLTVQVGSNATTTVTFGTGTDVGNLRDLNAALSSLAGGTASVDSAGNLTVTAGNNTDSIVIGGTTALPTFGVTAGTTAPGNNADRAALETEFNNLRTQIDQLASDASFNGNNLLDGDNLTVIFNEEGTSTLSITGVTFNTTGLGISQAATDSFQNDANVNARLSELETAIGSLRQQASTFGSQLSVVEIRQDFTKNLINTLETGAGNLTLADSNEEGANTLALQTRQQLSSVALSLASQADQAVLRLF